MTPAEITATRQAIAATRAKGARLFGIEKRRWRRIELGQIQPFSTLERLLAVALVPGVAPILEAMVAEEDAYAQAHPEVDKEEEEEEGAAD
jgi:hypothetical protein